MTSWLSETAAPAALLDELVKIGEDADQRESNKKRILRAAGTAALAGLGTGAGVYAAKRLVPHLPAPTKKVVRAVQIGLPIMGGTAMFLGSRYRKKIDEGLSPKSSQDGRRPKR